MDVIGIGKDKELCMKKYRLLFDDDRYFDILREIIRQNTIILSMMSTIKKEEGKKEE